MNEKTIENKLRNEVKKLGGMAVKFFSFSFTGMPDRIVLLPGGHIRFVELKSPGKKPTPRQAYVHRWLESIGFKVFVIDSDKALQQFITICQNLTRQKMSKI